VSNQDIDKIAMSILPALVLLLFFLMMGLASKYIWKTIMILTILLSSITIFFKWRYQVTITEDIILSGMINDSALTTEMISLSLLWWMILTAGIPIYMFSRIHTTKTGWRSTLYTSIIALGSIGATMYLQGYEYRAKGQIRDYKVVQAIGSFAPVDILYAYKKASRAHRQLNTKYQQAKEITHHYVDNRADENQLVVLIVGESTRGDHLSINGYDRETSSRLEKIDNLFSFHHALSCDTLTLRSVHYMFSPLTCDTEDSSIQEASFTTILKSLGYGVEIFSLQTLNAFYHYLGYDTLISKYAVIREQSSGTRDISLLPYIQRSIKNHKKGKKLIVIHTLGSHQSYFDRIDTTSLRFEPTCNSADVALCTQEQLINSYDNTVVAIDDFISSIIDMLSQKKAMLIYISDHGESLGEEGVYFHGTPKQDAPREQFSIPFLFWFSDSYIKMPEVEHFTNWVDRFSLDANISHDYLFHSILGCSGISSDDGIAQELNLCQ